MVNDIALSFDCEGDTLQAVLSTPAEGHAELGVLIVVGGPQYRVGSHRQFRLLAQELAQSGFAAMRFDVRGMGDSTGSQRDFEAIGPDILAALHAMQAAHPSLQRFVLWGLCDAASAALMHCADAAPSEHAPAIAGLVLLNPWVRSAQSLAQTHVKHYYSSRLRQADFWRKLLRGGVAFSALTGLMRNLRLALRKPSPTLGGSDRVLSFQSRMAQGWQSSQSPKLLILSGQDLTAQEFLAYAQSAADWKTLLNDPQLTRHDCPQADHTFSNHAARAEVASLTCQWLRQLSPRKAP